MPGLTRRALAAGFAGLTLSRWVPAQAADYRWEAVPPEPDAPIVFTDARGRTQDLSSYRGQPLLLNLWATWCGPCVVELPALDRLQRDLGKSRLRVLALSLDRGGMRDVNDAHRRLRLRRLERLVDASGAAARVLRVAGLPSTYAIDAGGRFLARRRGAVAWDSAEERRQLEKLFSHRRG